MYRRWRRTRTSSRLRDFRCFSLNQPKRRHTPAEANNALNFISPRRLSVHRLRPSQPNLAPLVQVPGFWFRFGEGYVCMECRRVAAMPDEHKGSDGECLSTSPPGGSEDMMMTATTVIAAFLLWLRKEAAVLSSRVLDLDPSLYRAEWATSTIEQTFTLYTQERRRLLVSAVCRSATAVTAFLDTRLACMAHSLKEEAWVLKKLFIHRIVAIHVQPFACSVSGT